MKLGVLFLEIVNKFRIEGLAHLISATLCSEDHVYFTLESPSGTKYEFSIHKTEAEKND